MKTLIITLIFELLLFFNNNLFAQWQKINNDITFNVISVSDTEIYGGEYGKVYHSSNYGQTWSTFDLNSPHTLVTSITKIDSSIFVTADSVDGIFLSTDNGLNWKVANTGLTNKHVRTFVFMGTNLFVGTLGGGIFLSTNNGNNWTPVNNGLNEKGIFDMVTNNSSIFAGTYSDIYVSNDSGANWNALNTGIDSSYRGVTSLAIKDSKIFAGTYEGDIFLSTDNGVSWDTAGYTNPYVFSIVISGSNIFTGTLHGVYLSTNDGNSWVEVNEGWDYPPQINSLGICGQYIFAVGNNYLWLRPLSEMITEVKNIQTNSPTTFSLGQNYPNPFNPTTKIDYKIPTTGFVTLTVYDILGNQVTKLVNEEKPAGSYEVKFDGSGLSSGIYFYNLEAGSFTKTKKMIYLK